MLSNLILRSIAAFGGTPFRLEKCTALGSAGAGAAGGSVVGGVPGALVGGALGVASSLLGGLFGNHNTNKVNQMNYKIMQEQNRFNAEEAQKNRDWQELMHPKFALLLLVTRLLVLVVNLLLQRFLNFPQRLSICTHIINALQQRNIGMKRCTQRVIILINRCNFMLNFLINGRYKNNFIISYHNQKNLNYFEYGKPYILNGRTATQVLTLPISNLSSLTVPDH
jgi:hypothetical protein